jgi:hypothetical protein
MLRPKPATAAALVVGFAVALPPQTALANPVNYDCRINENPPPLCKFLSARSGQGRPHVIRSYAASARTRPVCPCWWPPRATTARVRGAW